jgi:hypothetical protein
MTYSFGTMSLNNILSILCHLSDYFLIRFSFLIFYVFLFTMKSASCWLHQPTLSADLSRCPLETTVGGSSAVLYSWWQENEFEHTVCHVSCIDLPLFWTRPPNFAVYGRVFLIFFRTSRLLSQYEIWLSWLKFFWGLFSPSGDILG